MTVGPLCALPGADVWAAVAQPSRLCVTVCHMVPPCAHTSFALYGLPRHDCASVRADSPPPVSTSCSSAYTLKK